jgi:hypothetical protein
MNYWRLRTFDVATAIVTIVLALIVSYGITHC